MSRKTESRVPFSPISQPLDIGASEFDEVKNEVLAIIADDEKYPRKIRNGNFFKKPSQKIKNFAEKVIAHSAVEKDLIWHFEVFFSKEPVLLHNDRNYFSEYNELCERGLIIPIDIVGTPHITRFFDLVINQKVNWDGEQHFKTLEKVVVPHDPERLKTYEDLQWRIGDVIFFDACQIHEAVFPEQKSETHKISINGLGYSQPTDH